MVLDVMLVPLVLFWAIGHEEYLLSAVVGVLFAAVADPGGGYAYRASHLAVFALVGAGLTALAFGIGGSGWGWLVLAAFAVTLLAGLAVVFGAHRFAAATFSAFGSSSPSGSRSPSIITSASPATPGPRCWRGSGGGALDRGAVHRVAGPWASGPAPAVHGDAR
jgi:hypothetical protein